MKKGQEVQGYLQLRSKFKPAWGTRGHLKKKKKDKNISLYQKRAVLKYLMFSKSKTSKYVGLNNDIMIH